MDVILSICLWHQNAREMAEYYRAIFTDYKLVSENPMAVIFETMGTRFMCLNNCAPHIKFNEKISFVLTVDTQQEIDAYWSKLTREGQAGQCGWVEDKYGVSWQVVPGILGEIMNHPETAHKAAHAFMQMSKIEIAKLEEAVKR